MVEAALDGSIDYSRARLQDWRWWRSVGLILDAMERRRLMQSAVLYHMHSSLTSLQPLLTDDARGRNRANARSALRLYLQNLQPWVNWESTRDHSYTEVMRDAYTQEWGDPSDPQVARKHRAVADSLMALAQQNRKSRDGVR